MLVKLTPGYYYTKEAIKKNSFSAEEVFEAQFLSTLKNSSLYWMKEYNSLYFGTCFTICYLQKVLARQNAAIPLKRNLTFELNFHTKGEEVWFTTKTHLVAKSFSVNSNEVGIIDTRFSIQEIENQILSDGKKSCKTYSLEADVITEQEGFTQCAKQVLVTISSTILK